MLLVQWQGMQKSLTKVPAALRVEVVYYSLTFVGVLAVNETPAFAAALEALPRDVNERALAGEIVLKASTCVFFGYAQSWFVWIYHALSDGTSNSVPYLPSIEELPSLIAYSFAGKRGAPHLNVDCLSRYCSRSCRTNPAFFTLP